MFTDVRGEVVAESQFGVLDGPVMRQDRFVHVCLKPGEEGITEIVDRPDEVVDVRDVAHATFEVASHGGRDPEPIDGPSLDRVYAIHKTVRDIPRVDIDTLAGTLKVGAERVKRLSMTAFVHDEGGFYRDRAHMLFEEARAFAPHEQYDFELRGMTLMRTDASEVSSVRITFNYELDE